LLLAYITVCLVSKAGIGNVLKTMKYSAAKVETKEEKEQLPADYLT
ncbi:13144_t:CDS:1, partial [Ambispora gerdemannii]